MNRYKLLVVASILPLLAITIIMQIVWINNSLRIEKQLTEDLIHIALSANGTHQLFAEKIDILLQEEQQEITPLFMEQKETQWRLIIDSLLRYQGVRKLEYGFQILIPGALESEPTQGVLQSLHFKEHAKLDYYKTYKTTIYPNYKRNPFAYGYQGRSYTLNFNYNADSLPIAGRMWTVVSTSIALVAIGIFSLWMALVAIRKQNKSEQVRVDFLNGMTHELNTPITVIQLAAQYIKKKYEKKDTFIQNTASIIQKETNKMKSLVTNILTTARLNKDKFQIKKEPVDIHQLLHRVLETYKLHLKSIKHKKKIELHATSYHTIGDAFHLFHTFSNLVDNAIKYRGDKKGTLELSISTHSDRENNCIVKVQDNGIGISEKNKKEIFVKSIPTNIHSSNIKGFGFGLGYVKDVIRLHKNASVNVESDLGKGSTFTITLSCAS